MFTRKNIRDGEERRWRGRKGVIRRNSRSFGKNVSRARDIKNFTWRVTESDPREFVTKVRRQGTQMEIISAVTVVSIGVCGRN